jgi:hypothetical protein
VVEGVWAVERLSGAGCGVDCVCVLRVASYTRSKWLDVVLVLLVVVAMRSVLQSRPDEIV